MDKGERLTIRITARERAKIAECAAFTGVSSGEFVRRAINVMLMVMGDRESERRIRGILREATGIMKVGAGRQPVPPKAGRVTGTPRRKTTIRREEGK